MAIIYTYPAIGTIEDNDLLLISDVSLPSNATRNTTAANLAAYVSSKTNLNIAGDNGTTGSVNLGNQSLLLEGTANQIQTTANQQSIQLGFPNAVIMPGSLDVSTALVVDGLSTFNDSASIVGDLSVGEDAFFDGPVTLNDTLEVNGTASFFDPTTFESSVNLQNAVLDEASNPGTVGQVLSSTGAGSVVWADASDAIPPPLYIVESTQRVGIRTAFPQVAFHVDGAVRVRGDLQVSQQNNNTFVGENMPDLTAITGSNNTALGDSVMPGAINASSNTGIGALSLNAFVTGNNNTAIGAGSMELSSGGSFNTALGSSSLSQATTGQGNTAIGSAALTSKTTSNYNTAVGRNSLEGITVGFRNTAIGNDSGRFIADGVILNSTGNQSIFIGDSAKPLANAQNNQIVIGYGAIGNGSNTATIGNVNINNTYLQGNLHLDATTYGGLPVQFLYTDTTGKVAGSTAPITNSTDTYASTPKVNNIVTLTQSQYDALATPDVNTLFIII